VKVVLVTSIERGGPVEHARLLARELVAAGAQVRAVTTWEPVAEAFAAAGAEPVLVPTTSRQAQAGATIVRRSARGFDVVHSHDRRSGLWALGPPRRARRIARVHTLHGLPDAYLPLPGQSERRAGLRNHLAYRVVEGHLVGRADAVVVPSQATLDLARRLGYRMARAEVIVNGADVAGEPSRGTKIGMVTALEPVKGIEVFLDAARSVRHADPDARFVIFGTGSLLADLQALVRRLDLDDVVELAGQVPAATAMAQLRVLVATSHFETSPLALLEAMGAGVAVVTTRVGGIPELAPEDAMLMVPPGDAPAVAVAIRRALVDDDAGRARVERARAHIETERSAKATMEAMTTLYRRVLDQVGP
jgi:glycosyltransferase involved in cell wall biosynthesis